MIVEHCLALGFSQIRPSARARLEATLGRDLTPVSYTHLTLPTKA